MKYLMIFLLSFNLYANDCQLKNPSIGTVCLFRDKLPTGFIKASGQMISKKNYPKLYSYYKNKHSCNQPKCKNINAKDIAFIYGIKAK